jgi:hypothetical protein
VVVAIIKKRNDSDIQFDITDSYDNYVNIIRRTGQLTQFAHKERCRIDWINFFPVELKSDDVLDDRLPNQILNAILTFGRAILVLDKKHSERAKLRGILNPIPATIIGYTGREDYVEVLSVFRRFIITSRIGLNKKRLVKLYVRSKSIVTAVYTIALKISKGSAKSLFLVSYMIKIPVLQRTSLNLFKNWQI